MANRRNVMFWSGLGFIGLEMFIGIIAFLSVLEWNFINMKFLLVGFGVLLNILAVVMIFVGLPRKENNEDYY